jgi:hypothetical protein
MDFEPAQGGGVAGEGSGSELCRCDGQLSVGQSFVSGLDTGVGNAGDAGARTHQSSLRVALGGSGLFLAVKELAFGVDEHTGKDQLRPARHPEARGLLQELVSVRTSPSGSGTLDPAPASFLLLSLLVVVLSTSSFPSSISGFDPHTNFSIPSAPGGITEFCG